MKSIKIIVNISRYGKNNEGIYMTNLKAYEKYNRLIKLVEGYDSIDNLLHGFYYYTNYVRLTNKHVNCKIIEFIYSNSYMSALSYMKLENYNELMNDITFNNQLDKLYNILKNYFPIFTIDVKYEESTHIEKLHAIGMNHEEYNIYQKQIMDKIEKGIDELTDKLEKKNIG